MTLLTADLGIYLVGIITETHDGWRFTCLSRHLSHQSAALTIRPDQYLFGPEQVATPALAVMMPGDALLLSNTGPNQKTMAWKRVPA